MRAFVFGAGAHGRVVADILRDMDAWESISFVDDDPGLCGAEINGIRVVGSLEQTARNWTESDRIVIALGNPHTRLAVAARAEAFGMQFLNAVHPSATIAGTATLGRGNMICAMGLVASNARLGCHIIVNHAAVVEHDCTVADGATICPRALLGGRVTVEQAAFLGMGAVVLQRRRIGRSALVGAGALVFHDVAEKTLVMGSPARVKKHIDDSFDWSRAL